MTRPVNLDKGTIQYAQEICINPDSVTQLKKDLSVVLASTFGADADTIGQTLGIDRSTVFRYRDELSKIANGLKEKDTTKWGGRRNCLMTKDEEAAFLEKWIQPALDGELVNLNAIHMDHMAAIGKKFSLTTTSRLLMRNGWRKITPDTRHPKSDPAIQEDFKKNSQKRWMPPLK